MSRNIALYAILRITAAILPYVSLRLAYALADLVGNAAYYLLPTPRRAIVDNLSVVCGTTRRVEVQRRARHAFRYDARNWVDTLRIGRLSDEEILGNVEVDGWERLESAVKSGSGVILLLLHLGNFDLVGQVLAARGYRVTIPVEHMDPPALFSFLMERRRSKGLNAVPVERAAREMILAARRGELVAIGADRAVAGRAVQVNFFGASAPLPVAAVSLARHTGAPVLLGFGVRLPTNRFRGFVSEPLELVKTSDKESDERENVRRIASAIEPFIAQYADQWLVFSPVWRSSGSESRPATIGQRPTGAPV